MSWPEFDFNKRRHSLLRQRLSHAGKSNIHAESSRLKTCRSLATDSENVKSKKRKGRREGSAGESSVSPPAEALPGPSLSTSLRMAPSEADNAKNSKRIPPLSPVLINGFMRRPTASTPLRSNISDPSKTVMLTPPRAATGPVNPDTAIISQSESPVVASSSKATLTPPRPKMFAPIMSPVFPLRRPKTVSKSQNGCPDASFSVLTKKIESSSNNPGSGSDHNRNEEGSSWNPEPSTSPVSKTTSNSTDSSLTLLDTLPPPSQIDSTKLLGSRSFSERCFSASPKNFGSESSVTIRYTRSSDSGSYVPESVVTVDERSPESFLDVTIPKTEPNDRPFSDAANILLAASERQLEMDSSWEAIAPDESSIHLKQQCRLSKLAEALKKQMLIRSSDLVMWKCEVPKQQTARLFTTVSNTEQWGISWISVKNFTNSASAFIVDSGPLKKASDAAKNRNQKVNKNEEGYGTEVSLGQGESQEIYALYQPIDVLSTSLGEVILAPRYYR